MEENTTNDYGKENTMGTAFADVVSKHDAMSPSPWSKRSTPTWNCSNTVLRDASVVGKGYDIEAQVVGYE